GGGAAVQGDQVLPAGCQERGGGGGVAGQGRGLGDGGGGHGGAGGGLPDWGSALPGAAGALRAGDGGGGDRGVDELLGADDAAGGGGAAGRELQRRGAHRRLCRRPGSEQAGPVDQGDGDGGGWGADGGPERDGAAGLGPGHQHALSGHGGHSHLRDPALDPAGPG